MTEEEKNYKIRYNELFQKVALHMGWTADKTATWFKTQNPLLGGMSPLGMFLLGRLHKLEAFIETSIEENK